MVGNYKCSWSSWIHKIVRMKNKTLLRKNLQLKKKMLEIALCQSCHFMAGSLIVHNFQNWKEMWVLYVLRVSFWFVVDVLKSPPPFSLLTFFPPCKCYVKAMNRSVFCRYFFIIMNVIPIFNILMMKPYSGLIVEAVLAHSAICVLVMSDLVASY